jgi:hypothetical protein
MRSQLTLGAVILCLSAASGADITLTPIGTYTTGIYDQVAAEIVAHDPVSQRLFVSNSANRTVDILSIVDPTRPTLIGTVDVTLYGDEPTSVAFHGGLGAVAVPAAPKTDPGALVLFDRHGTVLSVVPVGALPDSVSFTPDGRSILVANEGEPSDDYTVDPEGSISIVDVSRGGGNVTAQNVRTAGFAPFNRLKTALRALGIRIYGPTVQQVDDDFVITEGGASVAQDIEPEYVAISPDSRTAWATLQENNALAVIDIHSARVTRLIPLGYKLHFLRPNALDASDRDGEINIDTWPVRGMYQPDWVQAFETDGRLYLLTANEGDVREYDTFVEAARVGSLTLGGLLARIPELQDNAKLGRLNCTTSPPSGKLAGAGPEGEDVFRQIHAFGARSFSIWTPQGSQVFDSGSEFERVAARVLGPEAFNSTSTAQPSPDNRSDDKGPEPEAAVVGRVGGRSYAFIGLERAGGIMIYDVTDPTRSRFVDYVNNRDFSVEFDIGACADCEDDCAGDCADECESCKSACEECADCPEGEDCTEACQLCEECGDRFDGCEECSPELCQAVADCAGECSAECMEENCPQSGVEGRDPLDLAPEGLLFIPADESPEGYGPLLVVTNEVSGSTTVYSVVVRAKRRAGGD